MALGTPSLLFAGSSKSAGTTLTLQTDENTPAGDGIVAVCGFDNSQTANGDTVAGGYTPQLTCADEDTNAYARIVEATESEGSADDGLVAAAFLAQPLAAQLDLGDDIVFTNTSSETAKSGLAFRVPCDEATLTVEQVGIERGQDAEPTGVALTDLPAGEYLFVLLCLQENNGAVTTTFPAPYDAGVLSAGAGTTGGGGATNQRVSAAYRVATVSAGHDETVTGIDLSSTVGGHLCFLIAIKETAAGGATHERAADFAAASSVEVGHVRDLLRQAAISAVSTIEVGYMRDHLRAVDVTAVATVEVGHMRELFRSVGISAASSIEVAHMRELLRQIGITAVSSVEIEFMRELLRSVGITAASSVEIEFMRELLRSVGISAASSVEVGHLRELLRQIDITAASSVEVAGIVEGPAVERSASFSAASSIEIAHQRELQRAAVLAAVSSVEVGFVRELFRQVSIIAVSDIAVGGTVVGGGVQHTYPTRSPGLIRVARPGAIRAPRTGTAFPILVEEEE